MSLFNDILDWWEGRGEYRTNTIDGTEPLSDLTKMLPMTSAERTAHLSGDAYSKNMKADDNGIPIGKQVK